MSTPLNQEPMTNTALNIEAIRQEFPILHQQVQGNPLVYLDNAATTQKPTAVIEAVNRYYRQDNANIHRGVHTLSERATAAYEGARDTLRKFINAASTQEIIFVRGATEGINLVAQSFARPRLKAGDEILVTQMEHHANIVPWQMVCEQTGASLKVIPMDTTGALVTGAYERLLNPKTKLVALCHISNALGTINPVKDMIDLAHAQDIPVLLDSAQAAPHSALDVQQLDCDFCTFSGHKMYGPTGVGILYGKEKWLAEMPPYQGGGDMIRIVRFDQTSYAELPYKFEAGTPNIAGGIGLAAAANYMSNLDLVAIADWETQLLQYATEKANAFPGLRIIGTASDKAAVLSFVLDKVHPHDLGTILDNQGVAIRTGHHCAMPVMDYFGVPATARASFSVYNTLAEIDTLFDALQHAQKVFT